MIRKVLGSLLLAVLFIPFSANADEFELPSHIVLKTDFKIWELNLRNMDFFANYEKSGFFNIPVKIVDDNHQIIANDYLQQNKRSGFNIAKIKEYLDAKIAPALFREKGDVIISENDDVITFEGSGLYGRRLDTEKAAFMLKNAIENDIEFIHLPLIIDSPIIDIDKKLKKMGITEAIAYGESDFTGSTYNRIHNVQTGLNKFNGHIIKEDEEFVFGEVLGPVNGYTGYRKELVIKGDKTVPEYGGGLCQVSTTAFRAALNAGLPINERHFHSYSVSYYVPRGLDSTVYPPTVDLKFTNDTGAPILIQTLTIGKKAYYTFYGTKNNDREAHLIGPYYSNYRSAPRDRTVYTDDLEPGKTKILGHRVSGFNSSWFHRVDYKKDEEKSFLFNIYSRYQARPNYYLIGKEKVEEVSEDGY